MKWYPNRRLIQCAAESQNDKVGVIIPYGTCFNYSQLSLVDNIPDYTPLGIFI